MGRNEFLYCLTRRIARIVFSLFYQVTIEREARWPPSHPAVILPKHQYWTDIPLVSLSFREGLYFLAKKELFVLPGIRALLLSLGGVPVDRNHSIRTLRSFKYLLTLLNRAEKVVVFPEGTYVRNFVGLGKSRLLEMILENQPRFERPVVFIPVGIHYGPRTGWRRAVRIRIGRPFFGKKGMDASLLVSWAMEEIRRLSELPKAEEASSKRREAQGQGEAPGNGNPVAEREGFRGASIQNLS